MTLWTDAARLTPPSKCPQRPIGETLTKAVGLVDASVAHQRRIRNLFSELESRERTLEQMDNNGEEEVPAVVQVKLLNFLPLLSSLLLTL